MRIMRIEETINKTGLSRTTIYRLMADVSFPQAISLSGARSVGWVESEVIDWIEVRIEERDQRKV